MPRISCVFQAFLNKKYCRSPAFFKVETLVETFYLEVLQQNKTKIILLIANIELWKRLYSFLGSEQ